MANRHTNAHAKTNEGQVTVSSVTTDSPILPIEQLTKLREIAPDRIDWVFHQTEAESTFRRDETRRTNTFVFVERMAGLVFALLIALMGLGAALYLAMAGHDVVAGVIGGATVVGLVSAFVAGRKSNTK